MGSSMNMRRSSPNSYIGIDVENVDKKIQTDETIVDKFKN